jgi:hypothetical protein
MVSFSDSSGLPHVQSVRPLQSVREQVILEKESISLYTLSVRLRSRQEGQNTDRRRFCQEDIRKKWVFPFFTAPSLPRQPIPLPEHP